MSETLTIKIIHEGDASTADAIIKRGLREFNFNHLGPYEIEPVRLAIEDKEGNVQGGLLGGLTLGWLIIDILWVDDHCRGRGFGGELLAKAEEIAISKGAKRVCLDTMEYQAPAFYEKYGYVECGRIEQFAGGFDRIYMQKYLGSETNQT